MNFRVQILSREGQFISEFGHEGDELGSLFRPKGMSIDSEGNIYLADAALELVQVFAKDGTLLYTFGGTGTEPGQMQLPAGLWIDSKDRVFVVDSFNQRVQMYQFTSAARVDRGQK
jgi:sugar lactone lactonase YvrE